jgi:hypothetical protein
MAVKKKNGSNPTDSAIVNAICAKVRELYEKHAEEIAQVREDSEDRKVTVTFPAMIDCSESAPKVKISMRFSTSVTDSREVQLEDPNQGEFTDIIEQVEPDLPTGGKAAKSKKEKKGPKSKVPNLSEEETAAEAM